MLNPVAVDAGKQETDVNDTAEASEKKLYADNIYEDAANWHVNLGDEKIHPKKASGKWRSLKWLAHSVWLIVFLGPYLRWGDRQAILFDIPDRQFHIFGITILPQDVWMLSLVLLFFALLLAAVTSVAGRVYCGFFCFQTAWTDVFVWLEEKIEGAPPKRRGSAVRTGGCCRSRHPGSRRCSGRRLRPP